jgi:hypothetical protein
VIRPLGAGAETHPERNYAPAIYGSLLVTGIVAIQWRGIPETDAMAVTVAVSVLVFWLTHVWAEIVNRRVRGPITTDEAREIALDEASMLSALVVPSLVLVVGPRVGLSVDTTVGVALLVSIGQLFLWGLVVGRAAHHGWALPLVVAVVDSLLGIAIVAMKVAVLH